MRRWDPALALACLSDADMGITHTLGVPVQFYQMASLPEFEAATFPTVDRAGVGAAPVTEDLLKEDLGISSARERRVLLKRLEKDARLLGEASLIFDEPKSISCDVCTVM